jgi:hypothetical protein
MAYATADEFLRRIAVTSPSAAQVDSANDCLAAATQEIDSHLGWLVTGPPVGLTTEQAALLKTVCLDRASEHWRNTPFGALSQGPELAPVLTARDSWYRHSRKLASLETEWGVA